MMMRQAPLVLTPEVRNELFRLRNSAVAAPVDVRRVLATVNKPIGEGVHRTRMRALSVTIPGPWSYVVTFSIETGHPAGTCRHMSMSIDREGRVPSPEAVWMVARELGFAGSLDACASWPEDLRNGNKAINLVQPLTLGAKGTA